MEALDDPKVTPGDLAHELQLAVYERERAALLEVRLGRLHYRHSRDRTSHPASPLIQVDPMLDLRNYYAPKDKAFVECIAHKVKNFVQNGAKLFEASDDSGSLLNWKRMYEVAQALAAKHKDLKPLTHPFVRSTDMQSAPSLAIILLEPRCTTPPPTATTRSRRRSDARRAAAGTSMLSGTPTSRRSTASSRRSGWPSSPRTCRASRSRCARCTSSS